MSRRLALIIGNSIFRDSSLARLSTPDADVGALADVLLDPEIGGFDDVELVVNMSTTSVRRSISKFFTGKTRNDLLVLYFSGHGVLDENGRLYLATKETERNYLRGTAIPAAYITDEMDHSRSRRQVLILDCCHSGAFARGSKGAIGASVGTASTFEGKGFGRVVLTATDATQYAWEGDRIIGAAENSLFTHYIIQGLQTGRADIDDDGLITIDELYDYVFNEVITETPKQTPGKWSYQEQGEIILARSPRYKKAPSADEKSLDAEISVYLNSKELTIEPGHDENLIAIVSNQGGAGENLQLSISGIPSDWLTLPSLPTELSPGRRQQVGIRIHPPRAPKTKAGKYVISLQVTSQDSRLVYGEAMATLTIAAISEFRSQLHPQKIRAGQMARVTIHNRGNFEDTFTVNWQDNGEGIEFSPPNAEVRISEGQSAIIEFKAKPRERRLMGGSRSKTFTAEITASQGKNQSHNGAMVSGALLPTWVLVIIPALCGLVAGAAGLYYGFFYNPARQERESVTQIALATPTQKTTASPTEAANRTEEPVLSTEPILTDVSIPTDTRTPTEVLIPTDTPQPSATPTPYGGGSGQLVIQSGEEILTIPADGSGSPQPLPLTDKLKSLVKEVNFYDLKVLPDGLRAAVWVRGGPGIGSIYLIDADENEIYLTDSISGEMAWAPDSTRLAYICRGTYPDAVFYNPAICVVSADGNNTYYVLNDPDFKEVTRINSLAWSPDGSQIAYTSDLDGDMEIYTVAADGSTPEFPQQLTRNQDEDTDPAWSPESSRLAIASRRDGDDLEIHIIANSGRSLSAPLTENSVDDCRPVWSPDGQQIAFISFCNPSVDIRFSTGDVHVMPSDGSSKPYLVTSGFDVMWIP